MPSEAERVAAALTEAQREALDWVRPHSIIAPYRKGASDLPRLGLVEAKGVFFSITPLGLAVRAVLERTEQGEGK